MLREKSIRTFNVRGCEIFYGNIPLSGIAGITDDFQKEVGGTLLF